MGRGVNRGICDRRVNGSISKPIYTGRNIVWFCSSSRCCILAIFSPLEAKLTFYIWIKAFLSTESYGLDVILS